MTHQTLQSKTVVALTEAKTRAVMRTQKAQRSVTEAAREEQIIQEGREFPEFVKHCVASMASNRETMQRLKQRGGKAAAASAPYAICQATYDKNKHSLAARHSDGPHHTKSEFEAAIKKLAKMREDLRDTRFPREQVVFETTGSIGLKGGSRQAVRFVPEEQ